MRILLTPAISNQEGVMEDILQMRRRIQGISSQEEAGTFVSLDCIISCRPFALPSQPPPTAEMFSFIPC